MKKLVLAAVVALFASAAFAHSGGTDSKGCHKDHSNGTYHCH